METARDIAIILLAIINIVWLLILCAIGYVALRLFLKVKSEVPGLLDTAKGTATSVKGTADFMGEMAATPVIRVAGLIAAVTKFLSVLFGGQRRRI